MSSSDLSSALPMRMDKEHACREQGGCFALWDPLDWAQGQVLVSMLQKRSCTTYCLAGKNTKTSETENRGREETLGLKGRCSKGLAYGNKTGGQLSLCLLKAFTEQTDWLEAPESVLCAPIPHWNHSTPARWCCFSARICQLHITVSAFSYHTLGPSCVIFNLCNTCWENALNSPVPWQPDIWK